MSKVLMINSAATSKKAWTKWSTNLSKNGYEITHREYIDEKEIIQFINENQQCSAIIVLYVSDKVVEMIRKLCGSIPLIRFVRSDETHKQYQDVVVFSESVKVKTALKRLRQRIFPRN